METKTKRSRRQVEVDMLLDHENRKVTIYRMDTAELVELVEEREMYDSEMQADLFEEDPSEEDLRAAGREAVEEVNDENE